MNGLKINNIEISPLHVLLKWNEATIFHVDAPDTILKHCEVIVKNKNRPYVWWGKISISGHLGLDISNLAELNSFIDKYGWIYLFLYCPDKSRPTMHVAKVTEISDKNMTFDINTPTYYSELSNKYPIPFWFKICDIKTINLNTTLKNLLYTNGDYFDPVQTNFYPLKVKLKENIDYFTEGKCYRSILGGIDNMRCFKNGCECNKEIEVDSQSVFVGLPFQQKYFNFFDFVIKPACAEVGKTAITAKEKYQNIDIMCKICELIKTCGIAIIDISEWNANVLFELGLLYGVGKKVLLIKHSDINPPVDLSGIEYVQYRENDFNEAKQQIVKYLAEI